MNNLALPEETYNEVLRLVSTYRREAKKCRASRAYLAGCVMMGAAFEGALLAFADCYVEEATASRSAPRKRGGVRPVIEWSLSGLLGVAREQDWLPSGLSDEEEWDDAKAEVGDYGRVLIQLRNLVHPARYASDFTHKRVTKHYLESSFEIFEVAVDHLVARINESISAAITVRRHLAHLKRRESRGRKSSHCEA